MTVHTVLFLCTHNSARSIFAEAILERDGGGRFRAFSAGSEPGGVHSLTIKTLQAYRHDISSLRSKSLTEFTGAEAPEIDFVFTLCDTMAGENCPLFKENPVTAHWGIEDPASGTHDTYDAFLRAYGYVNDRVASLLALSVDALDEMALRTIGRCAGATALALSDHVISKTVR